MKLKPKPKPNGILYIDVQVPADGGGMKRQRISLDTRDMKEAEAQVREWLLGTHPKHPSRGAVVAPKGRAGDGKGSRSRPTPQTGVTMKHLFGLCERDREVWGDAKAQATIRSNVNLLCKRIGDETVTAMTRKRLQQLADDMLAEGYKPASVKRKMDMVSKALNMAVNKYEDDDGRPLLEAKPKMPTISIDNGKDRVISADEELMIFAAIDQREAAEPTIHWRLFARFLTVLRDTAFRKGEAFGLGPDSVIMARIADAAGTHRDWPYLSLPQGTTKNDKPHMVPSSPEVAALIPLLNANANGGQWFRPLRWVAQDMLTKVRADVKGMGGNIDDVTFHTFRHTCLTRLSLKGFPLDRVSKFANHSDISITAKRYVHLGPEALAAAIDMFEPTGGAIIVPDAASAGIWNDSIDSANRANAGTARLN